MIALNLKSFKFLKIVDYIKSVDNRSVVIEKVAMEVKEIQLDLIKISNLNNIEINGNSELLDNFEASLNDIYLLMQESNDRIKSIQESIIKLDSRLVKLENNSKYSAN